MPRALFVIAVAFILALGIAACGEEEEAETPSPTVTPAETATPAPTETAATATPLPSTPTPAAPTPEPGTQEVRRPTWAISELSGVGQLQVVIEDGLNTYTIASVDPEVSEYERWEVAFVADVNGDGLDDAIVNHFTGGAHCCFEYLIFSQGPSGILLVDAFLLGNATIRAVEDLDGDGMPELDTADDRLAYFPDLSFAASPFLPLVLCRSAQRVYYDCTPQFPEVLGNSARQFEASLSEAVERQDWEDEAKRSPALGLLAAYLRLGQDEEGWTRVGSLCPECEAWLRQNLGELEKRLSWVQPFRGWEGP